MISTETYSREKMMAMLSALPKEEQQWTLDYLQNVIYVSMPPVDKEPCLPTDIIEDALDYMLQSIGTERMIAHEDVERQIRSELGWR